MRRYIFKMLMGLRSSFWFLPAMALIGAFVLSYITLSIDKAGPYPVLHQIQIFSLSEPGSVREVLSTIAASILGVTGTTFSITIVAVAYAGGQYGPRLVGNFMRDRGNQITLSVFIGTFVYSLLVLAAVSDQFTPTAEGSEKIGAFVPAVSTLVSVILMLLSISVLIYFFHHVPETLNISNLTARISKSLRGQVDHIFPDEEPAGGAIEPENSFDPDAECIGQVSAQTAGYILNIDVEALCKLADKEEVWVRIQARPGDFVTEREAIMDIHGHSADSLSDDDLAKYRNCVAIGRARTARQNILFLIDELVEIIGRALSPGINDPFTAITCFNWIENVTSVLQERDMSSKAEGRVAVRPVTFKQFIWSAFDQSRQYVARDRNVSMHVMKVLTQLAVRLSPGERRDILMEQTDKLLEAVHEQSPVPPWYGELKERHRDAHRLINSPELQDKLRNADHWFCGRG